MKLNYRKYGAADSDSRLLILHGLLGSSQNWHSVAQMLSAQHLVLVPDFRNHGDSPWGEHRLDLIQNDISELLENEHIQRTFLLGHSMGGLAAMAFAFSHADRLHGLMVEDIVPSAPMVDLHTIFEALMNLDLSHLQTRAEADGRLRTSITNSATRQFLLQNLKRQQNGIFSWKCNLPELQRFMKEPHRFKIEENQKYLGPTLFVGGGRSEYRISESADKIRKYFPYAEVQTIPSAGHWVHFDAMAEFVAIVQRL